MAKEKKHAMIIIGDFNMLLSITDIPSRKTKYLQESKI